MLRRLLESWLDSASERSYQSAFCQMLSAKGHTILHSTRHSALEFGKDIITLNPDGIPCAYQLKGNPGSRLSLSQFQKIQNQLVQLVSQPIIYPGIPIQPFNTFLVTNGIVEEEVQKALDELNRGFIASQTIGKPVVIISRGQILNWAIELGLSLWPSELDDVNRLLQLLVTDGEQIFPADMLHDLLFHIFLFEKASSKKPSANEVRRRITSASLLTAVSLRNFHLKGNHFAIATAWIIYSAYAIAACEKYKKSYKRNAKDSVEIACGTVFHCLSQLCSELMERKHYVEGDPLVDTFTYKGRFTLLVALMAIYWFWSEEKGWIDNQQHKEFISEFIPKTPNKLYLWGEGAFPQLLAYYWYLRANDASTKPDMILASLLKKIVEIGINEKSSGMPGPYYGFEDIIRHQLWQFLRLKEDPFMGDSFRFTSYYALSILHLIVRTNLKQTCGSIWPDFSRLNFNHFKPLKPWMFCLKESPEGVEITEQPKLTKGWSELVYDSRDVSGFGIPDALKSNKFLLILFLILFPHRGTPWAVRYLGWKFNESWFIDEPISTYLENPTNG
ncbi:hypothetical protein KA005_38105 [bacterium]|nr:hypothetical protein [bacterium]